MAATSAPLACLYSRTRGFLMEASAVRHVAGAPALAGRSPLLRLQSDEKLVALIRRGHHGAFEALVNRYHSRLLAFCRHMLGTTEDAEDVLQEVFTAAFNAIAPTSARSTRARGSTASPATAASTTCAARQHAGQDSMDIFERDGGATTADTVHKREEFRQIVADVQELPESQRTRAAPARDRRALLRADRRGDGHHGAEREVAARARARVARGGRRGAAAHLRRGAPRARPGGRGPRPHLAPGSPPPARAATAAASSAASCATRTARWPPSTRSARWCWSRSSCGQAGRRRAAPRPAAARPPRRGAAAPAARRLPALAPWPAGHRQRVGLGRHRHGRARRPRPGLQRRRSSPRRRGGQAGPPPPGGSREPREGRRGPAARPAGRLVPASAHGRGACPPPAWQRPTPASATKPVTDTPAATPAEALAGQPQLGTTDQGGSTVTLPQQPSQTPEGAADADPTAPGVAPAPTPIVTPAPPFIQLRSSGRRHDRQPGPRHHRAGRRHHRADRRPGHRAAA